MAHFKFYSALDQFGRFSQLNKNLKLSLVDYGDKNKKYSGGDYILKSYGVEVLNSQKTYILYQGTVPLKSTVDLKILYQDKKIVAFRIREFSRSLAKVVIASSSGLPVQRLS